MENFQLIILAGGKGTRMKAEYPKVLAPLQGKTMLSHVLEKVKAIPNLPTPVIVVGHQAEMVKDEAGPSYLYAHQDTQNGTGHAVQCAKETTPTTTKHVMVLYGDQPLIDSQTIKTMAEKHLTSNSPLTMATVSVSDFNDWRQAFDRYGRIIRDDAGNLSRIVEYKDASPTERSITEVNPSFFCFEASWLWDRLAKISNSNAQGEYYLTDLLEIATTEKADITSVAIEPLVALGANSKEDLEILERLLAGKKINVLSAGIEPAAPPSEGGILSIELREVMGILTEMSLMCNNLEATKCVGGGVVNRT